MDSDLQDLLTVPSGDAAAATANDPVVSSDEDTSDEAFAVRHAVLEAEEQQRFNSFAGKPCHFLTVQLPDNAPFSGSSTCLPSGFG